MNKYEVRIIMMFTNDEIEKIKDPYNNVDYLIKKFTNKNPLNLDDLPSVSIYVNFILALYKNYEYESFDKEDPIVDELLEQLEQDLKIYYDLFMSHYLNMFFKPIYMRMFPSTGITTDLIDNIKKDYNIDSLYMRVCYRRLLIEKGLVSY